MDIKTSKIELAKVILDLENPVLIEEIIHFANTIYLVVLLYDVDRFECGKMNFLRILFQFLTLIHP